MKKLLLSFLTLATISTSATVKDVGVIGPDNEVLLYHREGDYIIVKACEPNTVLGSTTALARSNCNGKSNKVHIQLFKQKIRDLVSLPLRTILKPLTPEEVVAYHTNALSSDQMEDMETELEKINNFIAAYGSGNANLVRKEELVNALYTHDLRLIAIKKLNVEIDKVVNLIVDNNTVHLTSFDSAKDQFLYTVLKQFDPNKKLPCGLIGSVGERIKDCSYNLEKEGFVLVARSKELKEVYKELSSGLLWSDDIGLAENYYHAGIVCKQDRKEFAGIFDVTWRLPSINEYKEAEQSGIRKALPQPGGYYTTFWSSTVRRFHPKQGFIFDMKNGEVRLGRRTKNPMFSRQHRFRCVADHKEK